MERTIKMMVLTVVSLVTIIFFTACDKEMMNAPLEAKDKTNTFSSVEASQKEEYSEYGLIAYPNGVVTLKDFEKTGKIRKTVKEFRQVFNSLEEAPLVPLVFHKDGRLYTADEYNRLAEKQDAHLLNPRLPAPELDYYGEHETFGVTDIETFKRITGWSMVDRKYALDGMFDPYQKYYETEEDVLERKQGESRLRSASNGGLQAALNKIVPGNIMYGKWESGWSDFVGHTAGIVEQLVYGGTSVAQAMMWARTTEATGANGVFNHRMTTAPVDWSTKGDLYKRAVIYPKNALSSSVVTAICNYQNNQIDKPYNLWSGRDSEDEWYCSKLQRRAYLVCAGIELDDNGGKIKPRDILYDNDMDFIEF